MNARAHDLDPRVRSLWWTLGALAALAATVASFVASGIAGLHFTVPMAVALGSVALAAIVPPLRYRRWSYEVRERDALIARGALFHVQQVIPFDRIQFVESRQGPLDRLFGLTQVVVYTAAGRAARVPGLSGSQAMALREELSRVAGTVSV